MAVSEAGAAEEFDRKHRAAEREQQEQASKDRERAEAARKATEQAKLKTVWDSLPEAERAMICRIYEVTTSQPMRAD